MAIVKIRNPSIKKSSIRKSSIRKSSAKILKSESSLEKTRRIRLEKDAKDLKNKKDKEKADKVEKDRQAVIIRSYLDKLQAQIKEKNLESFWTFPDRKGFKKIHIGRDDIEKLVKSDIKKYQNRPVVHFSLHFYHNEKNTFERKMDIWFGVLFTTYELDKDCRMNNPLSHISGGHAIWKTEDFKVTKFSLKLIEELMYPVVARKHSCTSITGVKITKILADLKRKRVNLDDLLTPLAGV
jgi:hypothetical protein